MNDKYDLTQKFINKTEFNKFRDKYFNIHEGGLYWMNLKDIYSADNYLLLDFKKFHYDKGYWFTLIYKDFSKYKIFDLIKYGTDTGNMHKYFKSYHFYVELYYYHRGNQINLDTLNYCFNENNFFIGKTKKSYENCYYNMLNNKVVFETKVDIDERLIYTFLLYIKINASYILDIYQFFETDNNINEWEMQPENIYFQSRTFYFRALEVNYEVYRFIPYKLKNCYLFTDIYMLNMTCNYDYQFISNKLLKDKKYILSKCLSKSFYIFLKKISKV